MFQFGKITTFHNGRSWFDFGGDPINYENMASELNDEPLITESGELYEFVVYVAG